MLVLRRALSGVKGDKDEHSICTFQGKVCSLIIDGGNCANVVSHSMVEKFNLYASAHWYPYNIQWINQGKGLQMNSRCLISFSIGKNYQVMAWRDSYGCMPYFARQTMDVDRKVMNDGYQNSYAYSKGEKKITLVILPPSQLYKCKPQKNHKHSNLFLTVVNHYLKLLIMNLEVLRNGFLLFKMTPIVQPQVIH